jgi:hypothetical protein
MSDLQDRRQARVAAELVAADDRFNAWQRANKELADEFRAAKLAAAEARAADPPGSSPEYDDLQRRRAADEIRAAIAHALALSVAPDEILEIVHAAVAKEAA